MKYIGTKLSSETQTPPSSGWEQVEATRQRGLMGFHVYRADAVDAARAADASQMEMLRAEIAVLRGAECEAAGDGPCGICVKCKDRQIAALSAQVEQQKALVLKQTLSEKTPPSSGWEQGMCRDGAPHYCPNCDNTFVAQRAADASQIAYLRLLLARADEGIQQGQACRSEAEFTAWTHDAQNYRPKLDDVGREAVALHSRLEVAEAQVAADASQIAALQESEQAVIESARAWAERAEAAEARVSALSAQVTEIKARAGQ